MKQLLKVKTHKLSLQADGSQCRDDGAVTGVSNLVKVRASKVFDSDLIIALKPIDNAKDCFPEFAPEPSLTHNGR